MTQLVSIIVPIRNEVAYIQRCLDSLVKQTWPNLEIWVIDGCSTDQTPELVAAYQAQYPWVKLLQNPHQTAPWAMNIGLAQVQGEVIIRIDGHCEVEPDYVARCMASLESTGADCVGGALRNVGETFWARTIALGMSSPFGVGNARFRYTDQAGEVDTLAFGAYRKAVFDRVGVFNTSLTRNQDDEFNYRLRASGGKIWLDPTIRAVYYTRGDLNSLWRQYYQYGWWKVVVIRMHPGSTQLRHLIPAGFVAGWIMAILLALLIPYGWLLLVLMLAGYGMGCLLFAARLKPNDAATYRSLMAVFPTLHLAYGCGFWAGLWRWARGKMPLNPLPADPPK